MILTRAFVGHALTSSAARRTLLTLSTGLSASEHFFPTLLCSSPAYRPTIVPHGLRAVWWEAPPPAAAAAGGGGTDGAPTPASLQHPNVLDAAARQGGGGGAAAPDFTDRVAESPYLFARKFSRPTSPLLTYIDTHMSGVAGAAADAAAVAAVTERANRHLDWLLAESSPPEAVTL